MPLHDGVILPVRYSFESDVLQCRVIRGGGFKQKCPECERVVYGATVRRVRERMTEHRAEHQ